MNLFILKKNITYSKTIYTHTNLFHVFIVHNVYWSLGVIPDVVLPF